MAQYTCTVCNTTGSPEDFSLPEGFEPDEAGFDMDEDTEVLMCPGCGSCGPDDSSGVIYETA